MSSLSLRRQRGRHVVAREFGQRRRVQQVGDRRLELPRWIAERAAHACAQSLWFAMQLTIAQDNHQLLIADLSDAEARASVEDFFWQLVPALRSAPTQ